MKTENAKSGGATGKTTEPNSKKQQSRTAGETKQTGEQTNTQTIPDWVMHLLTGAGAIGGNYLLFIKPIQEKLEAMDKAIKLQEKTIEKLQEEVDVLSHRLKKASVPVDDEIRAEPKAEDELFSLSTGGREVRPDFSKKTRIARF